MKVYITFEKDGYGGNDVDKVFSSSEKACQYIIERKFQRNDYYKKFSKKELMEKAVVYVEEKEVE